MTIDQGTLSYDKYNGEWCVGGKACVSNDMVLLVSLVRGLIDSEASLGLSLEERGVACGACERFRCDLRGQKHQAFGQQEAQGASTHQAPKLRQRPPLASGLAPQTLITCLSARTSRTQVPRTVLPSLTTQFVVRSAQVQVGGHEQGGGVAG